MNPTKNSPVVMPLLHPVAHLHFFVFCAFSHFFRPTKKKYETFNMLFHRSDKTDVRFN